MRLAILILLIFINDACAQQNDPYVDELENDGDDSENAVVALSEEKRSITVNVEPETNKHEEKVLTSTSQEDNVGSAEDIMKRQTDNNVQIEEHEKTHEKTRNTNASKEFDQYKKLSTNEDKKSKTVKIQQTKKDITTKKNNLGDKKGIEVSKKNEISENGNVNNDRESTQVYAYHVPPVNNLIESDDIMAQTSHAAIKHDQPDKDANKNIDDLMAFRGKRNDLPTFQQIHDFIHSGDLMSTVSNERRNELTATASKAQKERSKAGREKRSKISKSDGGETKGEMNTILSEIQSSKHHKLTRSDIRQLAKKAVMLATLKKLDEVHHKNEAKKSTVTKVKTKSAKKRSKKKAKASAKKSSKKKALSVSGKDVQSKKQRDMIADVLLQSADSSSKQSEFLEDITSSKKTHTDVISDDAMGKTDSQGSTDTKSVSMASPSTTEAKAEDNIDSLFTPDKKSNIKHDETKVDDDMFTNIVATDQSSVSKKSNLPNVKITDQIATLRSALARTNPSKVPSKFLSDLPSGIRMIAWKKLIETKKTELAQLETAVGGIEKTNEKPVMINIDIDQDKIEKDATAQLKNIETTDTEAPEKKQLNNMETDDDTTSKHVHYLQKHIKGARALRKLIAKTLVGHCKTTGKRILTAFVAMDKALARAQAIATVIGKKFNIDTDKINDLVGDKEDQVVETFLRDIFTKI